MSEKRKDEHVHFAKKAQRGFNDFDRIHLLHQGLVDFNLSDVDLSTHIFGQKFALPIYINAMTGGSEKTKTINERLALIAKYLNIPLFLGSQSIALKQRDLAPSFVVARQIYPQGFLVANVSANATVEEAQEAIKMIGANALAIHINLIQELVMEEGDRMFAHWSQHIATIIKAVSVPVIVKEVGFGMSDKTIEHLISLGVKYIDVSGRGGTNFATIERMRNQEEPSVFEHIGISTVDSLLFANQYQDKVVIHASGGVRHPLDVIKCLVLGAQAVGLSYYFLNLTTLDDKQMFEALDRFVSDLNKLMVAFGAKSIDGLKSLPYRMDGYAITTPTI